MKGIIHNFIYRIQIANWIKKYTNGISFIVVAVMNIDHTLGYYFENQRFYVMTYGIIVTHCIYGDISLSDHVGTLLYVCFIHVIDKCLFVAAYTDVRVIGTFKERLGAAYMRDDGSIVVKLLFHTSSCYQVLN